jgi:hypothetical protein
MDIATYMRLDTQNNERIRWQNPVRSARRGCFAPQPALKTFVCLQNPFGKNRHVHSLLPAVLLDIFKVSLTAQSNASIDFLFCLIVRTNACHEVGSFPKILKLVLSNRQLVDSEKFFICGQVTF